MLWALVRIWSGVIQRKHGSEKIEHDLLLLFFLLETGNFPLSASGSNLNLPSTICYFVCDAEELREKSVSLLDICQKIEKIASIPRNLHRTKTTTKSGTSGGSFDPDFLGNCLATVSVNAKLISS